MLNIAIARLTTSGKKIIPCLILNLQFLIFNSSAQAPNWLWAVGAGGVNAEQGYGIVTDVNGDIMVTGTYYSPSITFGTITLTLGGTQDIFIVKFSSSGNVIWAKRAGGTGSVYSNGIAADVNGNIFVTGMFGGTSVTFGTTTLNNTSGGFYDMFLVKYDSAENVLWAKKAGGSDWDEAKGVSTDASGNVFVTGQYKSSSIVFGTTTLTNSGLVDVFTAKYDVSGNVLWAKKGVGSFNDYSYSISADAGGNAFITGTFAGSNIVFGTDTLHYNTGSPSLFTVKYDPSGNVLWAKSPIGGGAANSIAADGSGNAVVTGWFGTDSIVFGSTTITRVGGADIFIAKYDAGGNELWAKGGGGTGDDYGGAITTDATGNIIATGNFTSSPITFGSTTLTNAGSTDIFVVKYDGSGNLVWAKGAGGTGAEGGVSVCTDAGGDAYVTGQYWNAPITFGSTTLTNAGSNDFFIAKLAGIVAIYETNEEENFLSLYPNPATNELVVRSSEFDDKGVIEIYNVLGEEVFSEKQETGIRNQEAVDVSLLSPGVYFVKVKSEKKEHVAKFVKL